MECSQDFTKPSHMWRLVISHILSARISVIITPFLSTSSPNSILSFSVQSAEKLGPSNLDGLLRNKRVYVLCPVVAYEMYKKGLSISKTKNHCMDKIVINWLQGFEWDFQGCLVERSRGSFIPTVQIPCHPNRHFKEFRSFRGNVAG